MEKYGPLMTEYSRGVVPSFTGRYYTVCHALVRKSLNTCIQIEN